MGFYRQLLFSFRSCGLHVAVPVRRLFRYRTIAHETYPGHPHARRSRPDQQFLQYSFPAVVHSLDESLRLEGFSFHAVVEFCGVADLVRGSLHHWQRPTNDLGTIHGTRKVFVLIGTASVVVRYLVGMDFERACSQWGGMVRFDCDYGDHDDVYLSFTALYAVEK